MKKFTIYTETKRNLGRIVGRVFQGFTLARNTGYWRGVKESSTAIILFTTTATPVLKLAAEIKSLNRQEAVLVEYPNGRGKLV